VKIQLPIKGLGTLGNAKLKHIEISTFQNLEIKMQWKYSGLQ